MGLLDRFKDAFRRKSFALDVSARFRLDRHAYTGTMSKFHVATDIRTGKVYGIKLLDSEKLALFRGRFKGLKDRPEEGEIGMKIDHPRVAKTYEYGKTTTGQEYILMEYIDGPGLNTILRDPDERLLKNRLHLIRQMAEGLQAVHEAGFIHRDICPRNYICINDFSWLKLIDFGLSVPNEPPYRLPGNRTGTPQYMAPEIIRRRPTDHRVDIFAFGVTVYRFLALEHPWGATDVTALAALNHDQKPAENIHKFRPQLNAKLSKAVHRCLEIKPENRFESIRQFLSSIADVRQEDE
ncbi:MAG: serine/threonine protein kinase [Pirellulaceae bacterium]|nr:serine/threonine protein kinase [Pirellulaceae bacterium]